jgi:hypothetical protein
MRPGSGSRAPSGKKTKSGSGGTKADKSAMTGCTYKIALTTADRKGAGTDAKVTHPIQADSPVKIA